MAVSSTPIAWTDSTWSPTRGCSRVNPDCDNCYAMRQAHRFSGPGQAYEGLTRVRRVRGPGRDSYIDHDEVDWSGVVRLVPEMLDQPLRWRKPRRIFVDSMSDLFHPALKKEEIAAVFGVMAASRQHTFQILTKRPKQMLEFFEWAETSPLIDVSPAWMGPRSRRLILHHAYTALFTQDERYVKPIVMQELPGPWPLPNVHLGVSAGHQEALDEFVPLLLRTPAALRFVSIEPQTEEVELSSSWLGCRFHGTSRCATPHLEWVITGGESGHDARPFDLAWARKTRDQCKAASVPWFLKQIGSRPVADYVNPADGELDETMPVTLRDRGGKDPSEWPADLRIQEFPGAM